MLCSVTLLVLTCAAVQARKCGSCNCYTGDGHAGQHIKWESLKTVECLTTDELTSVPDTSILPADTQVINIYDQLIPTIKQNQFITFKKLQIINLDYCDIYTVESHAFRHMTNVTVISLNNNEISTLPTDLFTDTPNLQRIYLGYNKISVVQENLFLNLKQLEKVYIHQNEIISIEKNSFVNLPRLTKLLFSTNKLSSLNWYIMNKMMSLKYFQLYSNPWHCDRMLCEVMSAYVYSHLWDNGESNPTCASPAEVEGYDWEDAVVTMCNSTSALQPGERHCGTCRCTDHPVTVTCAAPYRPWIAHDIREAVVKLNITGQNMSKVNDNDFLHFKDLEILYLENNNIKTVESNAFEPVQNLKIISLGHNKLTSAQKIIFSNLINLEEVNLSYNELISIEDYCFANLPSLESVDLSNNRLQTLKLNIFGDVSKLSLLALHDNPWKCDLSLCPVMNAAVSRELWAADKEPMCSSPRHVHKKPWTGVHLQFQPSISSSVTSVTEGDNVTLHCDYCFVSRVRWTFNGRKLPKLYQNISEETLTSELTLRNIRPEQQGYYVCHVQDCEQCDDDELLLYVDRRTSVSLKEVSHISNKPDHSNLKQGLLLLHYTFIPLTKQGNFTQSQSETLAEESVLKKIMNDD